MNQQRELRQSARLMVVDPGGRLLLFRYHEEPQLSLWATIGGELQEGEDYPSAAMRALKEEAGLTCPIGPLLREVNELSTAARSTPERWLERYILVRCPVTAEVVANQSRNDAPLSDEEQPTIQAWHWWTLEEMREADPVLFKPTWLPELLNEILHSEPALYLEEHSLFSKRLATGFEAANHYQ
ncbi:NUDIX hydrolase [Vreelandella sulfidaeris]